MPTDTRSEESATLSPDEAFAVLGDETRLQILQTLGEADEPLAFSALFDRIEYDDSSNFGYHLDKLVGVTQDLENTDQRFIAQRLRTPHPEAPLWFLPGQGPLTYGDILWLCV